MVTRQAGKRLARNAVNLLFPPRCILCDAWPDKEATSLCANCARKLDDERATRACPSCAATVASYEVSHGRCRSCRNRRLRVAGTVRVGPYSVGRADESEAGTGGGTAVKGGRLVRSHLGPLVRSYKFHGREEVGLVLGEWLAEVVAEVDDPTDQRNVECRIQSSE